MKSSCVTRGVPALAAVLLLSGCFTYRPADLGAVPVGEEIRVHLTRQGAAELPEIPGQTGTLLRGRVMQRDGDQLLLRVPVAVQQDGLLTRELGRDLAIPSAQVVQVERREFDRVRTGLTVAGGLGIAAILLRAFGDVRNEDPVDFPDPPVEGIRIPLFSVPLR